MSCLQVWLVVQFLYSVDFTVQDGFKILSWNRKYHIDILLFQFALRHVDLIFPLSRFIFKLLHFLLWLQVSDHFAQVPEKWPWMIVRVTFFVGNLTLFVLLLFVSFALLWLWLFFQIPHMEGLENRGNQSFDLANERGDRLCFWIKQKDAAEMF